MNQAERVASLPVLPVRRPAAEIAAALPADPFARQPWLRGRRLRGRPAVFVLASLIVALLASSAAPTPLYAIYQAQWHLGLGVPAVLAGFGVVHGGGLIDTTRYYGAAVIALAALALPGLLRNRAAGAN
jgi:hypothetical protein